MNPQRIKHRKGKGTQSVLIEWKIDCETEPSVLDRMREAADLCLLYEGVTVPCSITVNLCDDDTIREINRTYRDIDRATDVLSFPSVSYPEGETA